MNRSGALRLAGTMEEEIARAMRRIRSGRHPRPHYISCLIRDEEVCRIQARYGTLHEHRRSHRRYCFADVRVGSHRQDQVQEGGLHDNSKEDESYNYVDLPVGTQQDGIRHALWRLVEARYREAAEGLLRKKSHELTYLDQHRHLVAFEKRAAVVDTRWRKLQEVDEDLWRRYVERASRVPLSCPLIKNSSVELQVRNITRIFVGSEGSLQVQRAPYWSLECYLWLLSGRGDALPWTISHFVTDPREL
ncbi:MAG: hypothetical protein ACE5GW_11635, partial [Planctomycetota bacterium]